jgi:hypothetical protein
MRASGTAGQVVMPGAERIIRASDLFRKWKAVRTMVPPHASRPLLVFIHAAGAIIDPLLQADPTQEAKSRIGMNSRAWGK